MKKTLKLYCLLIGALQLCSSLPVNPNKPKDEKNVETHENEIGEDNLEEMGIEYNRYLREVVDALEKDPEFREKLDKAEEADIRSGKIAQELDFVNHHVRTKLDELKRQELVRLRGLVKKAMDDNNHDSPHLKAPEHLDHGNPNSFEVADLQKLIKKVTSDLAEADKQRREEFKQYEMQKHFEEEEKLKTMDEEHKKEYQEELEKMKKKHKKHEPLHHPGSKQQLEEVWEKQDHMENQEFNPKTFFYIRDLDGNGYWDQEEVKMLFLKELDKMYQNGMPEDDMRERAEEMERMREHVFRESDTNRDGLISFQEFMEQTKKPEFERDDGWEPLDQQQMYTPEEYAEFERRRQQEIERLIREGKLPPHPGMMMPHPGQMPPHHQGMMPPHPGQQYYQGHPDQFNQQHGGGSPQQGYPQQGHPQQGYPQPGMQPQQGMHPQQNTQPQQGMHPQQNAQPQQGGQPPQGNYPQQVNQPPQQPNYPPQGGIPQQPSPNQPQAGMPQKGSLNQPQAGLPQQGSLKNPPSSQPPSQLPQGSFSQHGNVPQQGYPQQPPQQYAQNMGSQNPSQFNQGVPPPNNQGNFQHPNAMPQGQQQQFQQNYIPQHANDLNSIQQQKPVPQQHPNSKEINPNAIPHLNAVPSSINSAEAKHNSFGTAQKVGTK